MNVARPFLNTLLKLAATDPTKNRVRKAESGRPTPEIQSVVGRENERLQEKLENLQLKMEITQAGQQLRELQDQQQMEVQQQAQQAALAKIPRVAGPSNPEDTPPLSPSDMAEGS